MADSVTDWGAGDYTLDFDWDSSTAAITSKDFNSQVHGDFTVVMNTKSVAAEGNIVVNVEASYDGGTTYVVVATSSALNWDGAPVRYIYDYDALGPLPFFRLSLNPSATENDTYRVRIYPHAGRRRF